MPRDEDMINRVFAVFAAVGSKSPLSIFDNERMKQYLARIAPGHSPPHRRERNRIVSVLMDGMMLEISKILSERRQELHHAFVSGTIDGWTDKFRKESFMAFVIDLVVEKYELASGLTLAMSRQTKTSLSNKRGTANVFLSGVPILGNAELILNFERFDESKTQENIADWMKDSCELARVHHGDFNQLAADGGEVGSVAEYEVLTRGDRSNDVEFDTCAAHQVSRPLMKVYTTTHDSIALLRMNALVDIPLARVAMLTNQIVSSERCLKRIMTSKQI